MICTSPQALGMEVRQLTPTAFPHHRDLGWRQEALAGVLTPPGRPRTSLTV